MEWSGRLVVWNCTLLCSRGWLLPLDDYDAIKVPGQKSVVVEFADRPRCCVYIVGSCTR
jgi:hypothetical protein